MSLYIFALGILFAIAIADLVVGVSNDAVNFLNSAVGSRVSPRRTIVIVASLGILAGVTFSSGMMEVARKGIFHPKLFVMPELITIFLAVMITDILLLDLFNTFGLPTSTTVSIVFELLGAAIAVSTVKIFQADKSILDLAQYINSGKALVIITGILLSVGIAFAGGAIGQFITRLIFTYDYRVRLKRYGAIWGGVALAMTTYFFLIKGAKGASFISPEALGWINTHTWTILGAGFIGYTVLFELLILFTRINILKIIVLVGTFCLAMAFAANDLVNFIGVPLAGFHAYAQAAPAADPMTASMAGLQKSIQTNTGVLLLAGLIMVLTLWLSRKARTVTRTERRLGRQEEGLEQFDSSQLSRVIVRMASRLFDGVRAVTPVPVRQALAQRINPAGYTPEPGYDGKTPEFDLLRASVNLVVASALVAWATSLKLPLSTTYVTFMVAMGASLSDQAWGLESAVYRVTGVLTVIGGWFFTALMAFTVALTFAFIISYLGTAGIVALLALVVWVVLRNVRTHRRREQATQELELLDLKRVTDAAFAVRTCFEHSGRFLSVVQADLSSCFDGIFRKDRKLLKQLRRQTSKIQQWSNVIAANIFKTLRLLGHDEKHRTDQYAHVIAALQEISESLRDMILRCHVHTANKHAGLLPAQREDLDGVCRCVNALLADVSRILLNRESFQYKDVACHYVELKELLDTIDKRQIDRIRTGVAKTRLSILFYGITNASLKIAEQTLHLLTLFGETFPAEAPEVPRPPTA